MIQSLLHCLSGTHIRSKSAATPAQSDVSISYKVSMQAGIRMLAVLTMLYFGLYDLCQTAHDHGVDTNSRQ